MQNNDEERTINDIAHDYLRAADEHEAKKEELLADWAEEYYAPGYLDDGEWDLVKDLMAAGETDDALMVIEVAIYRMVSTEAGRADEFEGDWPAKEGGPSAR